MWRQRLRTWRDSYGGFAMGIILFLVGLCVARVSAKDVVRGVSEAFMIAGILAFAVDPLVKSKAHRDATRDIFHHILGFNLPPAIKNRLLEIVKKTNLYRENTVIHCVLSEVGDLLRFDIDMEYEIVNPTQRTEPFQARLQFEKGEHPTLKSVTCLGKPNYGRAAKLTPNPKEPNSLAYRGKVINIHSQDRLRFKYEYSVEYPIAIGYFYQIFQYPTIGLSLSVKSPPTISLRPNPAALEGPGEWRYTTLFMPQDHLDIRWEKHTLS
jgi:hypothetical protein